MRGEHLGDVRRLARPRLAQVAGGRDVARLARPPRQRAVGDGAQQRLEEHVLPALGRARVVVAAEHLLGDEAVAARRSTSISGRPLSAAAPAAVNDCPSTDASCSSERSPAASPSRRDATSACSVSGTSRSLDVARHDVARALLHEQPAVLQHADRLDRVERDPVGAADDVARRGRRAAPARGRRGSSRSPAAAAASSVSGCHAGRRSRSSGRASASTKIGKSADHSSR